MTSILTRWTLVGGFLVAGLAAAQPANDTCAGAFVVPVPSPGSTTTSTLATGIDQTAAAVESPFACSSTSVKNSVWFSFSPTTSGVYRLDTCGSTTNYDTVMQVYSGSCASLTTLGTLGCNDQGGCIPTNSSSVTLTLTAGVTYFIQVAVWSGVTLNSSFTTAVNATFLLAHPEDECSATSPELLLNTPRSITLGAPDAGFAPAVNNAQLDGGACFTGIGNQAVTAAGRDTAYQFRAPATGAYSFRVGNAQSSTPNHLLYLTNSCSPSSPGPTVYNPPVCRAAANRQSGTITGSEEIVCVPMTANESVFVWFDEATATTTGGGAVIEVNACTAEQENNGTPATANFTALACPVTGSISPAGDVDFFSLGVQPTGARVFALVDGAASGSGTAALSDYDLRLTTATDTLQYDDDCADTAFGSLSASIAGAPLPGGEAFLRVNYWSASTVAEPYRLYAVVQQGTPVPEVEPNDNITTASGGSSNYFSGTVTSTTDVDFFAFEANAGDLVFLSLDSQPSRLGSTATGNHTLQLWSAAGVALVSVNDSYTAVDNTLTAGNLAATTPRLPSEGLWYRIRQSGTYYARVGRISSTGTGEYLLSISLNCGTGRGIGAPTLTSVTPTTGTTEGGTQVTLAGTGFAAGAVARFGATVATVVTRSATQLVVTTPIGNEGAVDVSVVNPGNQVSTLTGAFTYVAPAVPPTVTAVTPTSASTLGGNVITLTGTNFKAGAEVSFDVGGDVRQGTLVTVVSPVQLRVTTPAHVAGLADITVRNPADDMSGTLTGAFSFIPPPVIAGITPNEGSTSGGLTITISGTGFRTGATVRFGATLGTGVSVASDGLSLTVVTPSRTLDGPVDVVVTNPDTQASTLVAGFTYRYPAPTLAFVTPAQGFLDGGLTITLTGTNFLAPLTLADGGISSPAVTLGGTPATSVTRNSATQVTAVTPPGAPGLVDVTFINSDGQSVTRPQAFRYVPPPLLTAVSPSRGPVLGGTRITITGSDFLPGATVRVGGVPAFGVSVTPTEITAVTSAARPGVGNVTVVNPDTQSSTLTDAFTYDPAPTLTAVSPLVGSTAGGAVITITGSNFRAGAAVLFGSEPGTGVNVASETLLTVTSPAHPAGVVTVAVRNDDGQGDSLPRAFRFVDPPTVASATPNSGDVAGGTVVRLTGTGFGAQMSATFDGVASPSVTYVSSTALDVVTPPHGPGPVDIIVTTSAGVSATLTGGFTYTRQAPTVSAIAPEAGPSAGGTLVSITGTGFAPGATVRFGGTAATSVEVASPSLLRAVTPAHAAGAVDVVVTNDDGQSATLTNGYTYRAPPDGTTGLVADGGDGALTAPEMDAGTGGGIGTGGGGCGCASVDGSMLAGVGLGLLALARRRRR
jgi:hypothetical protein